MQGGRAPGPPAPPAPLAYPLPPSYQISYHEWQVYDIRYRAPRRDKDGKIVEEGSLTVWLNGIKVKDNARFGEPRSAFHPYRHGTTPYLQTIWKRQKETAVGPMFLQDHNAPVRFRNIWVRPLDDKGGFYDPGQK